MSFVSRLLNPNSDPVRLHRKELDKINNLQSEIAGLNQEQIRAEIVGFKNELSALKDDKKLFAKLEEVRPRVFALIREAAKRSIGQFHYDVQIIGGITLSKGAIAEMKTGEGKTLTATLPLVLHALAGRGAHLVTVNDYLARWQASQLGPLYHYLGLSIASIQHEQSFIYDPEFQPEEEEIRAIESEVQGLVLDVKHMRPVKRKAAYAADITYGTNNEYGFDYLRDNMVQRLEDMVQGELFFVIVDEVDSILIDEARTPLIISAPDTEPTDKYYQFAKLVERLQPSNDYEIDEKKKAVALTDAGISHIEKLLSIANIYDTSKGVTTIHHIEQALRSKTLFLKDRDYVVRDGEIIIVDEFTGRLMFGRRYSEGLHQAIEAKENVKIQQESKTLATITFQNLFRLYKRLSGMTGTAKTEEEEFFKIYRLEIVQIPTNKPMIRTDSADVIYKTEAAKFKAIATEVKERHKKGQPVLIGTVSIAKNEMLADRLKEEGVPFEILNAKNHEREAQIIAQAGRYGAVTVATNIAGRGVDILLGGNPIDPEEAKKVKEAGGLHILGTERHESRRIDNQLRGRSGRQGDPGSSQFFVSMEDDLMRLFGGERMKSIMNTLGIADDEPIEARLVSRSIEQAQKKIEGLNFDTRKSVLEFDDVLNTQRGTIYGKRKRILEAKESLSEEILNMIKSEIADVVNYEMVQVESGMDALGKILERVNTIFPVSESLRERCKLEIQNAADIQFALIDCLEKEALEQWEKKEQEVTPEVFAQVQRGLSLQGLDQLWMEHLDTMNHLRDSVRLRGYGQRDPLVEYKREGFILFKRLLNEINKFVVYTIFKVGVVIQPQPQMQMVTNTSDRLTGPDPENAGVGRNDPCPCGSGKKYKKCGLPNTAEHQQNMSK